MNAPSDLGWLPWQYHLQIDKTYNELPEHQLEVDNEKFLWGSFKADQGGKYNYTHLS